MPRSSERVLLLAHPAGHSLSPLMHGAAFAALGMDAQYEAVDVAPAELAAVVGQLAHPPYLGANVTVPHKEAVVPLMHELTAAARAVGAVNTIVRRGDRLVGHNTDGAGFLLGLAELTQSGAEGTLPDLSSATCLVLGAGGAARAVVHALAGAGANVHVVNRNVERANRLVQELAVSPRAASVVNVADLGDLLPATDFVVNTTSVGMSGGPDPGGLPLIEATHLNALPPSARVVDLVYRPAVTPLLAAAGARGLVTQNGLPMLIWQGAKAFEAWTGQQAPVSVMRTAAERGLAQVTG